MHYLDLIQESKEASLNTNCKRFEFSATFYASVIGFVLFYKQLSTFPAIVVANGGGEEYCNTILELLYNIANAVSDAITMEDLYWISII